MAAVHMNISVTDVASKEEYEAAIKKDRLQVVELYSDWAGPTQVCKPTWRKLALQHGGLLPFDISTACVDRLREAGGVLAEHPRTSQPHFLLFKGGKQLAHIVGVDLPSLVKAIQKHTSEGAVVQRQETEL